jgi:hypothetical protein
VGAALAPVRDVKVRGPLVLSIAAIVLVGFNLVWGLWNYGHRHVENALGPDFGLRRIQTNNAVARGIFEKGTGKLVWVEWDMNGDGKPDVVNFCFHGTNVLNLYLNEGQRPGYEVLFYGPGQESRVALGPLQRYV